VTSILYNHFEVGSSDAEEAKSYLTLDSRTNFDNLFKPLLLQWSRLHTAGLQAFFRMWKATGAELDDFGKVVDLIKILIEQVVGQTPRTKDVGEVEEEITEFDYTRLREMQMELLEEAYEGAWGTHLGYEPSLLTPWPIICHTSYLQTSLIDKYERS
jgi:engulfment and cell motility protein 1